MNPYRSGLSSAGKTGIVVILIVLVLGGAYLAPSLLKGGTQSTPSQPGGPGSTPGLLALFGNFSQMQVQETLNSQAQQGGSFDQQTVSYLVLGKASFNSTLYTKVEFSQVGVSDDVIAWFNAKGAIDRLDILGGKNYTGPGAPILAQIYTNAFGLLPTLTNNATLLSLLTKTSENTTGIGPTQLNIATYHLAVPSPPYKSITAKYATIPGTNQRLLIYLDEKMTDGTETTIQVTSLSR